MIVINLTMSFADEKSAVDWLKNDYIPLLKACPVVTAAELFSVEVQQGADNTYALQIRFNSQEGFAMYKSRFEKDFEAALHAKFTNQFGVFKTILTSL